MLRWWSRDEELTPPLVMTVEELRESADVFAIELLDIKRLHRTLFGEDIVAGVEVPMNLHRVEVEHELRTTLLRLRHHFLLASDNNEELRTVLAKSVTSVATLLRHALIALGKEPPHEKAQALQQAAETFDFDAAPLSTVLELRKHDRQPDNLRDLPCLHDRDPEKSLTNWTTGHPSVICTAGRRTVFHFRGSGGERLT